jgi:signal transduction histidine kinase
MQPRAPRLRLTIGRKIALALAAVVALGLLAMLLIYQGVREVGAAMRDLADKKEPASAATYEMEIQLHALGLAVLRYLDTQDPAARDQLRVADDQFALFHDRYLRLVATPEERELAARIEREYARFREQGQGLVAAKDEHERHYNAIGRNFERMDELLETRFGVDPGGAAAAHPALALAQRVLRVEAEMAEVGLWLANYHRVPSAEHRDLMLDKQQDVRDGLARLAATVASKDAVAAVDLLDRLFAETSRRIEEVMAEDTALRQGALAFVRARDQIDHLLDEEIQARTARALAEPSLAADAATGAVLRRIPLLMLTFCALALGLGLVLGRVVTRPVRALSEGAARVGQGDLTHRIPLASRDELADLSREFNRMVERLQTTTVSKDRLQESERQLREVVERLRQEIEERGRAERKRLELEASLRRAETMSAMGALVAGVAHEVRNPLFGISSVLDAMEARFASEHDSDRYLAVLREQVDRLTRLMQELLEYGKPYDADRSPASLADVIGDVVRPPVAGHTGGARLVRDVAPDLPPLAMDRPRLARALVNLVENAVQHCPPEGVVTIEARPIELDAQPWVEIRVSDEGPGIAADDLPRVFDPFFTRRRGGTGLGLSIVQRTVQEHGGTVSAENGPGGGAIFSMRLPIADAPSRPERVAS